MKSGIKEKHGGLVNVWFSKSQILHKRATLGFKSQVQNVITCIMEISYICMFLLSLVFRHSMLTRVLIVII